jgi:hypothetical protein
LISVLSLSSLLMSSNKDRKGMVDSQILIMLVVVHQLYHPLTASGCHT